MTVTTWQPFPETAPQEVNRPILVRGRWRPYDDGLGDTRAKAAERPFAGIQIQGGSEGSGTMEVVIAKWSTIMSNGRGYQWFTGWFTPMCDVNIEFTEWMDIPE